MRFDLRTPCKNCPFRTDETAIRFACRERAEQIEETAYRYGFPCHLSAELIEDDEGDRGGYAFGDNTQHCVGATLLYRHEGGNVPLQWLPEAEQDEIWAKVDWKAPVYESAEEFLGSYSDD